jgi:hypothetical protein
MGGILSLFESREVIGVALAEASPDDSLRGKSTNCRPKSGYVWFKTFKPFKPFKTSEKTERSG